jgi:hypothetical protein
MVIKAGKYALAWILLNRVSDYEMYMNCAP